MYMSRYGGESWFLPWGKAMEGVWFEIVTHCELRVQYAELKCRDMRDCRYVHLNVAQFVAYIRPFKYSKASCL